MGAHHSRMNIYTDIHTDIYIYIQIHTQIHTYTSTGRSVTQPKNMAKCISTPLHTTYRGESTCRQLTDVWFDSVYDFRPCGCIHRRTTRSAGVLHSAAIHDQRRADTRILSTQKEDMGRFPLLINTYIVKLSYHLIRCTRRHNRYRGGRTRCCCCCCCRNRRKSRRRVGSGCCGGGRESISESSKRE
jgi:hypothetical protein